jgi:hypothetical protein
MLSELLDDDGDLLNVTDLQHIQGPFQAAGALAGGLAGVTGGVVVGATLGAISVVLGEPAPLSYVSGGGLVGCFFGRAAIGCVGTALDGAALALLRAPLTLADAALTLARDGIQQTRQSQPPCPAMDTCAASRVAFIDGCGEGGSPGLPVQLVFMDGASRVRVPVGTGESVRALKDAHSLAVVFLQGGEAALEDDFVPRPIPPEDFAIDDSEDEDLYEMSRTAVPAPAPVERVGPYQPTYTGGSAASTLLNRSLAAPASAADAGLCPQLLQERLG